MSGGWGGVGVGSKKEALSDVCVFTLQVSSDGVQTDRTPLSELRLARPLGKTPERLPTVRSAPLHEGKRRRKKKSNSHTAARPSHTGAGALDTQLTPGARPGPKKEKLAEICRHLAEAHRQEASLYPHFRRRTPGGVETKLLGPGVGRALSSHPRVYFI